MTQEEQQQFVKDLCARLPYGVRVAKGNVIYPMTGVNIALRYVELSVSERILIEEVKPYLRPMSSMTKKEEREYSKFAHFGNVLGDWVKSINFLNEHHFDYNGWIDKGVALPAPDGMYND